MGVAKTVSLIAFDMPLIVWVDDGVESCNNPPANNRTTEADNVFVFRPDEAASQHLSTDRCSVTTHTIRSVANAECLLLQRRTINLRTRQFFLCAVGKSATPVASGSRLLN